MKKLTIIMMLLMSYPMFSQLIPYDKELHIRAGAIISAVAYPVAYDVTGSKTKAFIWSVGLSTLAGIGKETLDYISYGTFDIKDLGATMLGGLSVSGIYQISIPSKKKRRSKKRKRLKLKNTALSII